MQPYCEVKNIFDSFHMKYSSKHISLTTKHGKELVVAPPFRAICQASITVADIDTDLLGTFSGEVPREGSPREVVQKKARLGMQLTKLPYGIATEGSFGPHPSLPFLPYHEEVLVFIDDELGMTLFEHTGTDDTNFYHSVITTSQELDEFATRVKFPAHGVIIRPSTNSREVPFSKGITNQSTLEKEFYRAKAVSDQGKVLIETDMRAHLNPTRMAVIAKLAERLAIRLSTPCPKCSSPGWGVTKVARGLPCCDCGSPTELPYGEVFSCAKCTFEEIRPMDQKNEVVSSMYCSLCNP
jgi:hypothetical protein